MRRVPLHKNNAIGVALAALELGTDQLGRELVRAANAGDDEALAIVEGLRAGVSDAFLERVLGLLKGYKEIRVPHRRGKSREIHWFRYHEYPQERPGQVRLSKDWAYALVAVRLMNGDAANRLLRCQSTRDVAGVRVPCGKLFYGDPRKKWCSTTCGTRQRNFEIRTGKR